MKEVKNFEEFKKAVVDEIREWLPEDLKDAEIELREVIKNNDTKKNGLLIRRAESNMTASIYLEPFYKRYMEGEELELLLKEMVGMRMENEVKESFDLENVLDIKNVKDQILPRLIGADNNTELLKQQPHVFVTDLAVTFEVFLSEEKEEVTSIPVDYGLLEVWGVTEKELYEIAVNNLENKEMGKVISMQKAIMRLWNREIDEGTGVDEVSKEDFMIILSNRHKINGAAQVLDQKLMKALTEKIGPEFYMLPSSIHEWLIVPDLKGRTKEELDIMVKEVNAAEVLEEEILSDHAYRYTLEDGVQIA